VLDPWPLIRDERLGHTARIVLLALCRNASDDGTVRGGEWIATWTGLSRRSITTAVGKLKEAGMIAVQHRQRVANLYKIIPSSAGSVGGDGARGW
jgi:biotin operon repressor